MSPQKGGFPLVRESWSLPGREQGAESLCLKPAQSWGDPGRQQPQRSRAQPGTREGASASSANSSTPVPAHRVARHPALSYYGCAAHTRHPRLDRSGPQALTRWHSSLPLMPCCLLTGSPLLSLQEPHPTRPSPPPGGPETGTARTALHGGGAGEILGWTRQLSLPP